MRKWNICTARSETRSCKLHLIICDLDGLPMEHIKEEENYTIEVQIEWRVARKSYLSKRAVGRNLTSKQQINSCGCVHWEEGFERNCKLKLKDSKSFRSWIINLEVHGSGAGSNSTASVIAKHRMDIADFAGPTETSEKIVRLPVRCNIGGSNLEARLTVKLSFFEFQTKYINSIIHPLSPTKLLPSLSSCITFQSQTSNKMGSPTSESDEDSEPSYRSLVATNLLIRGLADHKPEYGTVESWEEDQPLSYQTMQKPSLARLLSWNNIRPSFSVLDPLRDAPLLNKAYGENGGDDIDNDRRCHLSLSQPVQDQINIVNNDLKPTGFVDSDPFEIGNWEKRKLVSRDGRLELVTEIFLANIDQRSEKASGEGACTVLAAVIADWLHQNPGILPLRCQFDKLISEGSSLWRNLCKEETNKEKFLDQHFDLDTVLQAQVRPLVVVSEKSYVGFFELENIPNQLEFLQGAMSFDTIWEELQSSQSASKEQIYVVSWNDHFFVLKIEKDAIYTIDTLGERLFEGCNKAYIVKFNRESKVHRLQPETSNAEVDSERSVESHPNSAGEDDEIKSFKQLICEGQSSCKEFIKGFLAALPLRELQADIKRGIIGEVPLHHLLQIEFQYTIPCNKNSDKQGDQILID
ncbi:uncharacterized protein LOC132269956 [Cornus florida]|uniref:uncharacterized protein LOC132269956 n=1 Tax=Cornus florida TaxID=4283 RepID=UPI0028A05899|nr:uncharacterized protein LOC132269956 [Cornus florida]